MSDTATAVQQIFDAMPGKLNANAASGLDCVIQYDLSGDGGGTHHSVIQNGTCTISEGAHDKPTMTITMDASDFVEMTNGRLDGMTAFMSGKLRVSGDMGLAMRMQTLFA
jgi:putative sterol carrier protein